MKIQKIFLVEDSKTETIIITKILEDAGYSVVNAHHAEQALERLRTFTPDLIVMDVVMPGQSGFQFIRTLKRDPATCGIPIIICSSKNLQTDRLWGLRQGAKDYVTKPVNAGSLLAAIERVGAA